jgi:two-component sensor histidine kinase
MREILRRWVVSRQPSALMQAVIALCGLAAATAARVAMMGVVGGAVPFLPFFPVILVVTVLTGPVGALVALAGGVALAAWFAPTLGQLTAETSRILWASLLAVFGGLIAYVALMLRDALREANARREQEHLLLLEIQHRVKNSLSVVQSLASQTLGKDRNPDSGKFLERLFALGEVHNLLSSSGWRPVALRSLADRAVQPFRPQPMTRITIDGDDLELAPDVAVSIALALHELATNALKHGALSNAEGQVAIAWSRGAGDRLRFTWTETGGPPVQQPKRKGFGSRLLQHDMGGVVPAKPKLEFRPQGVAWSVELPLRAAG